MNESGFTRSVNKKLPQHVYSWKVADRYTAGIPDCWYSGPFADLWVEFKFYQALPKRHVKPKLSELQKAWLRERKKQGRNVAVIVGSPQGCIIFETEDEWVNGKDPVDLLSKNQVITWITARVTANE